MSDPCTKIALTGGTGFIGQYLVDHLQTPVRRLVRNASRIKHPGDVFGDLTQPERIDRLLEGASTLIHLAASNAPRTNDPDMGRDLESNVVVSVRLFERFARMNPAGHIIFASSGGAVYDPTLPQVPRVESDPLRPISSYGIQKVTVEHYLTLLHRLYGVSATILRISNPYGVALPRSRAQGIVGVAYSCALEGLELPLVASLDTVRDYLHLDDLLNVFKILLSQPAPAGVRTYNVGAGTGTSTREVLDLIQEVTGRRLRIVEQPSGIAEPSWNVLDIGRITAELMWRPKLGLREGLTLMRGLKTGPTTG